MNRPTNDEILGKGRTVQPRAVPHGYQIEQWERHMEVFNRAVKLNPDSTVDYDSFMCGWNAAFSEIYGGKV